MSARRDADGDAPARRGGARPVLRPYDDDLRAELVAGATRALTDSGPAALSVRALAATAGTSTQAVYSLFGGKTGLIDAVLAEGFAQLGIELAMVDVLGAGDDAATDGGPDDAGVRGLVRIATAYRSWALERPALYAAMFAPRGRGADVGGLRAPHDGSRVRGAAQEPSDVLESAIASMLGPLRDEAVRCAGPEHDAVGLGSPDEDRADAIARALWACVHGWVALELRGEADRADAAAFEAFVAAAARGLTRRTA
ncbi:TetR/AcrR family transcriptional regulator [Brachybacterium huguangmaarense]